MLKDNPNPHLIIFALWLLMFSASSQLMIISPILPQIGSELAISESILGTLVTGYAVMLAVFALITGPISDKVGGRRILMIGTGAMAVALFLHSFAFDYYSFLTVRSLAGAAGGVLSGASVAYVGDYFPYRRRGWANGWIATGVAAGQIAGIPLGTVLAEWYGVHGPFALFSITMYMAFMLIWLAVPQPDVQRLSGRLTPGVALRNYLTMLRSTKVAAVAGCFGLMFFGVSLYIIYLPSWLTRTFGISGYEIATLFLIGGVANVLTGPQAGRLSDRIGRKAMIIWSCVGLSVVMALTTVMVVEFWAAYLLFFLTMVLVAARISPFQALVTEIIPDHQRGAMMSMTIALGQAGMGIGGALAGPLFSRYGYLSNTVLGAFSVLMMGYLVWRYIPEPKIESAGEPSA